MRVDYESVRALYALWSYEYILFFFLFCVILGSLDSHLKVQLFFLY